MPSALHLLFLSGLQHQFWYDGIKLFGAITQRPCTPPPHRYRSGACSRESSLPLRLYLRELLVAVLAAPHVQLAVKRLSGNNSLQLSRDPSHEELTRNSLQPAARLALCHLTADCLAHCSCSQFRGRSAADRGGGRHAGEAEADKAPRQGAALRQCGPNGCGSSSAYATTGSTAGDLPPSPALLQPTAAASHIGTTGAEQLLPSITALQIATSEKHLKQTHVEMCDLFRVARDNITRLYSVYT